MPVEEPDDVMSNDAKRMHYSEYPTIDMVFEEAEIRNKVISRNLFIFFTDSC